MALLRDLKYPVVPWHCGAMMDIISAKLICDSCGFQDKRPKGETSLRAMEWPKHCGMPMKLSRHLKCGICGYAMTEEEARPAVQLGPAKVVA